MRPAKPMSAGQKHLRQGRIFAVIGFTVIALTFGVMGGWSALAKIDRGVIAPGTVAIETNRKIVQHFEGGIVSAILVREGDKVAAGDIVARLQPVQAEVSANLISVQIAFAQAREARLMAERDHEDKIDWGALKNTGEDTPLSSVMVDEERQFKERRDSLEGQILIQSTRIDQHRREIEGLETERKSASEQIGYINLELGGLRELYAKKLVPATRLYAMERERSRLEGVVGRNLADIARIESSIGEIEHQMALVRQKFGEEVATSLVEVRQKISDYRQRERAAADVLERLSVRAPRAGTVQNVKLTTLGQVVRAGEPLLEIVPDDEPLIVTARFSPNDIDSVYAGQDAEVRFPAFHTRTLPLMAGRIETLSGDRLVDESNQPYFLGSISIDRMTIPAELRPRLRPGMPAEVIALAGERTVAEYLISPLREAMRRTFLER